MIKPGRATNVAHFLEIRAHTRLKLHRMKLATRYLTPFRAVLLALAVVATTSGQALPPTPKEFLNDYAGVTSVSKQKELNGQLAQFCKATSNQVVVAIFPKLDSNLSMDEYTIKVANSWEVGQRGKNNGVVLFVFVNDRKMRIQVGLGLTNVLTDNLCKKIIDEDLKPRFRNADFEGGLTDGVKSIQGILRKQHE